MGDEYIDMESLKKQVEALEQGEDLYMDVETFANSLDQVDNVEDLYICVESLPKEQTKAKKLVEAFADENIYLKPAVTEAKSWHDDLAIKLKLGSEDWYYGAIPRDKAERLVLDQACGKFLVRVSIKANKKSYAITVSMGKLQFLHIAVAVTPENTCVVDGKPFADVRAVVNHFSKTPYNGIVALDGSIVPKAMRKGGAAGDAAPPPPPPRRERPKPSSGRAPPPVPETVYDFNSDHIYASTLSDDDDEEDSVYEAPAIGQEGVYIETKAKTPTRSSTIKQQPLPLDIKSWTAGEVQRWLKEKKLEAFKKPFYANGVDGSTLFDLSGAQFPPKRFSQVQRDRFDAEIAALKKIHKPAGGGKSAVAAGGGDDGDAPPPPPRPSRAI
eukprot:m.443589 g.443589  ORF g.443589 m.443589 type:complete len:385 (-) comp18980_c0_seq1:56-1210(-)